MAQLCRAPPRRRLTCIDHGPYRNGSRIVSKWTLPTTERNTLTLREGTRVVFENEGDTQRVRGADGSLISEASWTPDGPGARPHVQPAFFNSRKPARLFNTPAEIVLDTCIAGRFLVLNPVGHAFCGVLFDTAGIAGTFRPRMLIFPIFAPFPVFELRDIPDVRWKYSEETVFSLPTPELAEQILGDIEAAVLPQFRSLVDLNTLYDFLMEGHLQITTRGALHFRLELAMGNFDAAQMLMRWHRRRWFAQAATSTDAPDYACERHLCDLLGANDHLDIACVLREIEETVAVAYEVDHLWQPSPFPFEDGYDEWLRQARSSQA